MGRYIGVWLSVLGLGCSDAGGIPPESEPLGSVQQATVWTTECTDPGGALISYNVKAAPYNALGNGSHDDTVAIQNAIDAAKARATTAGGTCAVQVYLPTGVYLTSNTLYVPSRVSLKGYSRIDSRILRVTGPRAGSVIELTDKAKNGSRAQCGGEHHIRVVSLTLEMRNTAGDTSKPWGVPGHCIGTSAGISYLELRDLRLTSCNEYGLGMQIWPGAGSFDCTTSGATVGSPPVPFANITMKGIRVVRSGSDGIDFKQPYYGIMNHDIDMHEICVGDVGWNDDGGLLGGSAVGIDLAGTNLWLDNFTHVNPVAWYPNVGGTTTYVSGIRFRTDPRNVTQTLVENFYVKRVNIGVFFEGTNNSHITLKNGIVREATTVGTETGEGIYVRGSYHQTQGKVFVADLIPTPPNPDPQSRALRFAYANDDALAAAHLSMSLSATAPTLPENPACTY